MKAVEIKVLSIRDGEKVTANICVEAERNGAWRKIQAWDVTSGMPEAERRILLEDNERVVITGSADTNLVYDRDQMATVPRPKNPTEAKQQEVEEKRIREQNLEREAQIAGNPVDASAAGGPAKPHTNPAPESKAAPLSVPPKPVTTPAKPAAGPTVPSRPGQTTSGVGSAAKPDPTGPGSGLKSSHEVKGESNPSQGTALTSPSTMTSSGEKK